MPRQSLQAPTLLAFNAFTGHEKQAVSSKALQAGFSHVVGKRSIEVHAFCIRSSQSLLLLYLTSGLPPNTLGDAALRAATPDLPFGWVAWVFGAFIVACGLTHAMEMWTLWYPVYWYAGVAKAFTAAVSLGTAWLLYKLTSWQIGCVWLRPSATTFRTSVALPLAAMLWLRPQQRG